MNNRFINIIALIASSAIFMTGCDNETKAFKSSDSDDTATPTNSGTISQKNFSILADDVQPPVYDKDTGVSTDTTVVITVKIGDLNNQLLTDKHTVHFATEWGLIEPSCVTENGTCSVDWQTSLASPMPAGRLTTITAYTLGEETFVDSNGNGEFDDADTTFSDQQEPFIDTVIPPPPTPIVFDENEDVIIDVMNGNELGQNGVHDLGDGFLNSPHCTHSSLCSTVRSTIYIWNDIQLDMNGPPDPPAAP
jgi:hypothetical protein